MEVLDLINIRRRFALLTGATEEQLASCGDFIALGKKYAEDRLTAVPDEEQAAVCEYFAACAANYYYVCSRIARGRQTVTSAGLYSSEAESEQTARHAWELLRQAKRAAGPLLRPDGGFAFHGV